MGSMATFFIKKVIPMISSKLRIFFLVGATISLCGCSQSNIRIEPDFGSAIGADMAVQIADPDARYTGNPTPGANGARTSLAQQRYQKGQVIQPSSVTASSQSSVGNVDNGAAPASLPVAAP
jgi:hypothetical protein